MSRLSDTSKELHGLNDLEFAVELASAYSHIMYEVLSNERDRGGDIQNEEFDAMHLNISRLQNIASDFDDDNPTLKRNNEMMGSDEECRAINDTCRLCDIWSKLEKEFRDKKIVTLVNNEEHKPMLKGGRGNNVIIKRGSGMCLLDGNDIAVEKATEAQAIKWITEYKK